MSVRPFVVSDLLACAEIVGDIWGKQFAAEIIEDCQPSDDYDFVERFVADRHGIVVGLCGIYRLKVHPENYVGVDWFVVSQRHQRKGIGTQLLTEALRRTFGRIVFVWATEQAESFYAKYGFVRSDYPLQPREGDALMIKK